MKKAAFIGGSVLAVVLIGIWATRYFAVTEDGVAPGDVVMLASREDSGGAPADPTPVDYTVERVAGDLEIPWSVVFTSQSRMLITERPGRVRVVEDGVLREEPLTTFDDVSSSDEEGLMGMVLDPDYDQNQFVYLCYAYAAEGGLRDRVVRLVDAGDALTDPFTVIEDIPAARFHAGCELGFGPDGKLYITTGDATHKDDAQDLDSLAGKILRLNADGSIPDDNPFGDSPVYSYGHRNPQGLDWHPDSGALVSAEHGPSVFDGPAGGDEVNRIDAGNNYGWPLVSHDESLDGAQDPLVQWTPAEAPGSAHFYDGSLFPTWYGDLFVAALKGEGLIRIVFTDASARTIAEYEKLDIAVGRVRDVTVGPDGAIYFTTSNRDGRGDVRDGDDSIYRIVPVGG